MYPGGECIIHYMFGTSVVDAEEREYPNPYVTAHLKVPGEMFCIALRKSLLDEGVVGSMVTYWASSLSARLGRLRLRLQPPRSLPGMVTSIV